MAPYAGESPTALADIAVSCRETSWKNARRRPSAALVESLPDATDGQRSTCPADDHNAPPRHWRGMLETVENVGLEALRAPHVRHVEGKLWELRVRAVGGIARGIYVTAIGRRVVVLHVFTKKPRKTPRHALATARERMKQVMT